MNPKKVKSFFVVLSLTFLSGVIGYYLRQPLVDELTSQKIRSDRFISSLSPTPISSQTVKLDRVVPIGAKFISYIDGNNLILYKIDPDNLGKSSVHIAQETSYNRYISALSQDSRHFVYLDSDNPQRTIFAPQEMAGYGHHFVLVSDVGTTKIVTSKLLGPSHIVNLDFVDPDTVFVSLENNDIYLYNLSNNQFKQIFSGANQLADYPLCTGFGLIDKSPDKNNIVVASRCFEGTDFFNLSLNSGKLSHISGGYGPGMGIVHHYQNNYSLLVSTDFYDQKTNDFVDQYSLVSLDGKKIKDIPAPSVDIAANKSKYGLYVKGNNTYLGPISPTEQKADVSKMKRLGGIVNEIRFY